MATLTERLEKCYASAVHDVLREMGHGECVLPPEIRLMDPTKRLAGEIYTISGQIDMSISRHESLLMWSRVLSRVPSGKVVVCQPNTRMVALMGELSAHALVAKGTRGYIVDGHARDVEQLLDMGFPIAADLATPADIVERWRYTALGEPITIGRVTIQSGDYVVADRDGAIIIPKDMVEEAVTKTEAVMTTESEMRVAIIGGMDAEEAYLKYGKF
ncbi:MAG: RraA family protein [Alphaproteobacteria bacterium]|jgi:regulator of RNase E activity RraA